MMIAGLLKRRDAECARHDFLRVHAPELQGRHSRVAMHRILRLTELLKASPHNSDSAAAALGVCTKTILRDTEFLKQTGIDIAYSRQSKAWVIADADHRCREFAFKFTHRRAAAAAGTTKGEK